MDRPILRILIRGKLADGRLPLKSIPRTWGGPGNGELCDACETVVTKDEFLMGGISLSQGKRSIQFHTRCFYLWDVERRLPAAL